MPGVAPPEAMLTLKSHRAAKYQHLRFVEIPILHNTIIFSENRLYAMYITYPLHFYTNMLIYIFWNA